MRAARDVWIWESEFRAHRVPPICIKTGAPADGTWTFAFVDRRQPSASALALFVRPTLLPRGMVFRAPLPLVRRRLVEITLANIGVAIGAAVALPFWLLTLFGPDDLKGLMRLIALAGLTIGLLAFIALRLQQPQAEVRREPSGQSWVRLGGVHPKFATALEGSRAHPAVFSADGHWYWDGSRWLTNIFPEQWWRSVTAGGPRLRQRQLTVGLLLGWALIGALAWWRFHS